MRKNLLCLVFLLLAISAMGQDLRMSGFDPDADEATLRDIRWRMVRIRQQQHRPTVALVLSGGGARGASHIGVLKYLEEIGMPIDMIVGTSMGGLMGGCYAVGFSADEIKEIILSQDWNYTLSDMVHPERLPYHDRKSATSYLLTVPFEGGDLFEGSVAERLAGATIANIPAGYVHGQNVELLLDRLTLGYHDSINFFDLPIPFVCVATDMPTQKAYIWHAGSLPTAMRSTMSIPGLFEPVRVGDMVLVDGGMRNNFPTDLARDMGADYVIGVDIAPPSRDIENVLDVMMQSVDMLSSDCYRRNQRHADVVIHPDLGNYTMLSFDKASIDTLIKMGYAFVQTKEKELQAILSKVGPHHDSIDDSRSQWITQRFTLKGIEVEGASEMEEEYLRSQLLFEDSVDCFTIERRIEELYGSRAFTLLTYNLKGEHPPYTLVLQCKDSPKHELSVGLRVDSEEMVNLFLRVGLNAHQLWGSKYFFLAKVGINPYGEFHYVYDRQQWFSFNAKLSGRYVDRNRMLMGDSRLNANFAHLQQELYLSSRQWHRFNLEAGFRSDLFNLDEVQLPSSASFLVDYGWHYLLAAFLRTDYESYDDRYFPTRGMNVGGEFTKPFLNSDGDGISRLFATQSFYINGVLPIVEDIAFLPSLNQRFLFGNQVPVDYANFIGGHMQGRYTEWQIPFVGLNGVSIRNNYLVVLGGSMRFHLMEKHYASLQTSFAVDWPSLQEMGNYQSSFGIGIEYAYRSLVGPLRVNLGWSSISNSLGLYLSFEGSL